MELIHTRVEETALLFLPREPRNRSGFGSTSFFKKTRRQRKLYAKGGKASQMHSYPSPRPLPLPSLCAMNPFDVGGKISIYFPDALLLALGDTPHQAKGEDANLCCKSAPTSSLVARSVMKIFADCYFWVEGKAQTFLRCSPFQDFQMTAPKTVIPSSVVSFVRSEVCWQRMTLLALFKRKYLYSALCLRILRW